MRASPSILPLRVSGLSYAVGGRSLLDDVGFEIAAGSRTLILGPNGAGKSLTLRLCHGLLTPTAGTVAWAGPGGADRRRHAMVFQRPVLLRRTARANLLHALALAGRSRAAARQAVDRTLARFGLTDLADRPARVLSGGEQQRLAMARAWALEPELLFLDEPTAALDPAATRAVEEMIAAFHGAGTAIVMTSHDLGQARRLADRVLFLHRGRLLEDSPADRFFDRPASAEAAAFLTGDLLW